VCGNERHDLFLVLLLESFAAGDREASDMGCFVGGYNGHICGVDFPFQLALATLGRCYNFAVNEGDLTCRLIHVSDAPRQSVCRQKDKSLTFLYCRAGMSRTYFPHAIVRALAKLPPFLLHLKRHEGHLRNHKQNEIRLDSG
jgi:hypothetical protein